MTKLRFLLLFTILSFAVSGQLELRSDSPFYDCNGALNLFENGDFTIQFTGKKTATDLSNYNSLENLSTDNMVWCSFVAPQSGTITFKASVKNDFLQMVVFAEEENDVCQDINRGISEIRRMHVKRDVTEVGLAAEIGGGVLYKLDIKEGQHFQIAFATAEKSKQDLLLNWHFEPSKKLAAETKVVDKRYDDFAMTLSFKVIDPETKLPVISNLSLEGNRDLNGLYVGSEFYFNLEHNAKLQVRCDAEGYFYYDSLFELSAFEDNYIQIELIRISTGKKMTIEEIEFVPGTSQITDASIPNLRRLKDFLALNSDIKVEIQGHVFALGDNSLAAQRVSEARAKRVLKYLVDNGIDKDRLSAVGFGNTKPIYEKPKFSYEEQANRRVEVMIK